MLCPHGHGIACGACADRIATLESRLAEVERERDEARRKAAELDVLLDAEKGEREQNRTAHIAQRALYRARLEGMTTRLHRIEQAAGEAADLLGIVASYVGSEGDAGLGQIKWARDARRVETALRAAMRETK